MIRLDRKTRNLQGANHDDTFDYSDPLAHWSSSRVAVQPQLGTLSKRRYWPDRVDPRDPYVAQGLLNVRRARARLLNEKSGFSITVRACK
jgi:hypothetical protein